MDGEDEPPDDLRYNGEGNKNRYMKREYAEDSFEASNCKTINVRSKSRNTILQSKTQAKPIDLSWTAHPQFPALNLGHKLDMHSRPGANREKSASLARWRQLYSQHQNGTAFRGIGGKTGQKRHWLMTNGGYSRS